MNKINPSCLCQTCGGAVPKWKAYCSMKCRDKAKRERVKLRETGLGLGETLASPPYPDSRQETIDLVMAGLDPAGVAFFESGREASVPEGFTWQVLPNGLGKLTRN